MSKTLSFSKDRVRVLVSTDLDQVFGGQGAAQPTATAVSSALEPTATAVSSAKPVHHRHHGGKVSSAMPTATAVSSALPDNGNVSSVKPTATAVSSALPSW